MRSRILIVGPLPPAIGGIASIVSLLHAQLSEVDFLDSAKPEGRLQSLFHPFILISKIFLFSLLHPGCKVLFFSSAFRSFWEKAIWCLVSRPLASKVFLVMVDGNFPKFYSRLTSKRKYFAKLLLRGLTVVAQSDKWKEYFQSIFPDSNVDVITGGVDTDYFSPTSPYSNGGSQSATISVLYVGWIIKEKGVFDILDACELLLDEGFSNFAVDLVGPIYCDKHELEQSIEERKLSNFVKLCGPIHSRDDLRQKYLSSDVFLFPSHFEGFPMALLEAIACGLPAIGTSVGGIPDILDSGNCGLLIEPQSAKDITSALKTLLSNHELRRELGFKARERAVEYFSLSASINSYLKLLGIPTR